MKKVVSDEAKITVISASDELNLYSKLYSFSLNDADVAKYSDLIKSRLADAQRVKTLVVSKFIEPLLPVSTASWRLDLDSGELIIND